MLEAEQKIVLKRINEIRKAAGLGKINKLKRGVPEHDNACCIAMSLAGTKYTKATSMLWDPDKEVKRAAIAVMNAFDAGKLPELEIPKTPVKIKYPGDRKATVIG